MRILLLSNKSPWPPKDGGAIATLNLIRGLSALNASVSILSFNTSKHPVHPGEIPAEIKAAAMIKLINIDTTINHTNLIINLFLSDKPYNLQRFISTEFSLELAKQLKSNFDIIQVEGLAMCHYLPQIRQNKSVPVIYRSHNIENLIWSRMAEEEKNPVKKIYFRILSERIRKIEKNIINEFDGVLPISPIDLKWLNQEGLVKPYMVLPPGYFPEEVNNYQVCDSKSVFFIGALDWLPNVYGLRWFIKEVWPVVSDRIPEATFHIAGRNASAKTISELKGRNVFFSGEVDSSADFIKEKSIMVVPLFSGSGIRVKIIEGMAYGKSVVATPVAAEGLGLENKKDICISNDVAEFADNIIDLLLNSDRRKKIGENAVNTIRKNYNILASSEKLMNFYREFLHDN